MVLLQNMTYSLKPLILWQLAALGTLKAISEMPRWLKLSHKIGAGTHVPDDFFGINIATNDDPLCDDYVIETLRNLGINNVRLSYSFDSVGASSERLLRRALDEGFDVLLNLLPPHADASLMATDTEAQTRWENFVTETIAVYGARVSSIEIGNTPNRGRWSGYGTQDYLLAWKIAAKAAATSQQPLAGPNVSDFEPIYNVGLLRAMKKLHSAPAIHTDNLFVERVVQPEAYDHRVASRFATRWLRLNLVKKARILADISRVYGVKKTYCTHTGWTRKRLSRWSVEPDLKNAHYLMRFLIIAAASGDLDRVYWGPLICERDGLIACGDKNYPKIDNVSYHRRVRGNIDQFSPTAACDAMRFCVGFLRDATCIQAHNDADGLSHFVFASPDHGVWHVVWCMDRKLFSLGDLYSDDLLANARPYVPGGEQLQEMPLSITEQPLVLRWEQEVAPPAIEDMQQMAQTALSNVVHWPQIQWDTHLLQDQDWRGVFLLAKHAEKTPTTALTTAPSAAQLPNLLSTLDEIKVLRDKRNRLWNIRAPWWSAGEQTVKLNRARGLKRISYRFLPSKGKRHWNNATEMLRLGINTPQPLGFFEQTSSNADDSYYICQFINGAFSCRDLFTAFASGQAQYAGIDKDSWLRRIAIFIAHMHQLGITHRDLSSGNLMMTSEEDEVTFYLIDIGRATFDKNRRGQAHMRFKDLNRICYKLDWPDRERLIEAYDKNSTFNLPKWWRLSLASFDWKQNTKKFIKGSKRTGRLKAVAKDLP